MSVGAERIWTWLTIAAFAVIVLIVGFDRLAPKPKPTTTAKIQRERLAKLTRSVEDADKRLRDLQAARKKKLYTGSAESVGATLLSGVTVAAQGAGVKLVAFRPQRSEDDGRLHRLPYLVLVEGPYPDVVKFARYFESSSGKIALNMAQLSSSDGSSDKVNGSFTIIAFTESVKEAPNVKKT